MKDEGEISRMLATLKAVDAPEEFEGSVRSRIARRRAEPSLSRPSFFLIAKFAFPLLLLLAMGGFLIVSNERELSEDMVPPVVDGTQGVAVVDDSRSAPFPISNATNVNSGITQTPVIRGGANSRPASQGGSEDIALSPDESIVFPDGFDTRNATVTNGQQVSEGNISPISVLSMLGISAQCNSTGCVASTVGEGSLAARAGIQSGDIISAIDGKPINATTTIAGKFTVSELTLIRSDKRINVSFAPR